MIRIVLRRLAVAIPVLLLVSLITFVLADLVPGDAARSILGANATDAQVTALTEQLGLNRPLPVRYGSWLAAALHGDLGTSIFTGEPVSRAMLDRFPATVSLIAGAVLLAGLLGAGLGIASALRGGWLGRAVDVIALLGMAVPGFWFALVLVTLFAVRLPLFPATGYTPFTDSPVGWFESLVLPVLTLGIPAAAPVAKQTRDGVLTELGRPYVHVLRARGVPERLVILKHVLRNAAAPVVTVLGIVVVVLLGGTVLAESVFVVPGLGGLAVSATAAHDIPTIQAIAVLFTVIVMVVNLLIEMVYAMVNPKVRT
ncbi:ABC transporter permease [Actinoplanes sp. NPDC051851]|uniref:ABC transporter permease n=1 Tax=Actinoplanes sp. NPDC051851 TaxID=3154753 RepID=UPI00341EA9FC